MARGTDSTVLGNRSPSKPIKMDVSSAVSLPRLKSRSARNSTLSSAQCQGSSRMCAYSLCSVNAVIDLTVAGPFVPGSSGAARFMPPAT